MGPLGRPDRRDVRTGRGPAPATERGPISDRRDAGPPNRRGWQPLPRSACLRADRCAVCRRPGRSSRVRTESPVLRVFQSAAIRRSSTSGHWRPDQSAAVRNAAGARGLMDALLSWRREGRRLGRGGRAWDDAAAGRGRDVSMDRRPVRGLFSAPVELSRTGVEIDASLMRRVRLGFGQWKAEASGPLGGEPACG
jgi:hypothetical protein